MNITNILVTYRAIPPVSTLLHGIYPLISARFFHFYILILFFNLFCTKTKYTPSSFYIIFDYFLLLLLYYFLFFKKNSISYFEIIYTFNCNLNLALQNYLLTSKNLSVNLSIKESIITFIIVILLCLCSYIIYKPSTMHITLL